MSESLSAILERECAAAALADLRVCPRYHMPCWVCVSLGDMANLVRQVTAGRRVDPWPVTIDPYLVACRHCFGDTTDSDIAFHHGFL